MNSSLNRFGGRIFAAAPKVSVHMITYNHEGFIADAIDGVLAQITDFPIEIVIGEDCSTDLTRRICEDYRARHPGLIRLLYSEKNLGIQANSLRTFEACRGNYIAFCEGDDYWVNPHKLQRQVDHLDANPDVSISMHDYTIEIDGELMGPRKNAYVDYLGYDFHTYFKCQFSQTGTFVIRKTFQLPHWYSEVYAGDIMLVGLAAKHGTLHYIDERLSVYRANVPQGATVSNRRRKLELYINQIRLHHRLNVETEGKFKASLALSLPSLIRNKLVLQVMTHFFNGLVYAKSAFRRLVGRPAR